MGVQRHLKASGIFARLWHRDGKAGYLPDVPRTLQYIVNACANDVELEFLGELVAERVLPQFIAQQNQ
jgi:aminoglycoside/choline kinase family phosphotransferase